MHDCSCDYDPPAFYLRSTPKARKRHHCHECGGTISPEETYERVCAKWEDGVDTIKTCERCVDLRTWVKNNVPCLCIMHGNQDEECQEAIDAACSRAPLETVGLRFGYLRRKEMRSRHNQQTRAALGTLTNTQPKHLSVGGGGG